jgi:acyl carrier protein
LRVRIENTLGVSTNQMTADTPFYDIGADSLDAVEIVMQLEEDFDITIPDADAEQIRSIGDAVRFIEKARRQSIQ